MQMAEQCRDTSSKWTSLDDTMSEFNLLILNSTVMLFLEPEQAKQFRIQTSQGRTAGDTQARSVPAFLQIYFCSFLPLLVNVPRKYLPARNNTWNYSSIRAKYCSEKKEEITFLGYGKPSFSLVSSLAWFTRLLKQQIYCLGSNVRTINSALTRNPFG